MRRFFTPTELISDSTASIVGQEAKHIQKVLRLAVNDLIEIFDGTGSLYVTEILSLEKSSITTRIITKLSVKRKSPFLFVAQSVLKGKKMDFLFQKLTELSVEGILPFTSRYSESSIQSKQLERFERISMEACKQCKRIVPIRCEPHTSFKKLLEESNKFVTKILFWEKETKQDLTSLHKLITPKNESTLIVLGPEGGFSDDEVLQAKDNGFATVSLGTQILRAETAAIASASIAQYLLGNFTSIDTAEREILA